MPRTRHTAAAALAAIAALALSTALHGTTAYADPGGQPHAPAGKGGDVRNVGPDYNHGKKLEVSKTESQPVARGQAGHPVNVGQVRSWLALDDAKSRIYLKPYKLRGIGDHIEVWVAQDTSFPAGDCRNKLGLTDVTDSQVKSFIHEFDSNIYPTESAAFSTPPDRDGSNALLAKHYNGLPRTQFQGDGDNIVVLVDNVRDANYYDPSSPDGQTYIAGFFYSLFNEYTDRNVMTIDAYDWLHRTGANPPDDSTDPAYVACAQSQGSTRPYGGAKPHLYEGTFAHEYQHLLEYYQDPDEESWVNEGLSDWAQTLVGYVDPSIAPDQPGADSHLSCFQGYLSPSFGGPENSLTEWGDQGGPEILCDYGAAYSFMEYLASHYGEAFMSALHREDGNGLEGLQNVLDQFSAGVSAQETLHNWAAAMALDGVLDGNGGALAGGDPGALSIGSMTTKINWDNAQAYDTPGAAPNGSDYVRLRDAGGSYLSASQLSDITFDGSKTLEPAPVEWQADNTPPDATASDTTCGNVPSGSGAAALYSGCGANLDRSIVRQVSVPTTGGALTFDALWDTEDGWDYGFAQISSNGGKTWQSLATADTTSDHDPGAVSSVTAQLPGFTGDSGVWKSESADLSSYAGQDVLIGFRYITDSGVNEAGFWVRNIAVGGTAVPSTLDGWQTITQVNPTSVAGYTVQLVGYDDTGAAWYHRLQLDGDFHGELSGADLASALGQQATVVGAIVMQDDPTESVTQYARYTLKANGVTQPGG
jgi:hypothetical protein